MNSGRTWNRIAAGCLAAAGLALATGAATGVVKAAPAGGAGVWQPGQASQAAKKPVRGSFEREFGSAPSALPREAGSTSEQTMTIVSNSENGDTYRIVIRNGAVSAERNGKPVPAKQIRRHDGKVEILDDDGDVAFTADIDFNSPMAPVAPAPPAPPAPPAAGGVYRLRAVPGSLMQPPPVMIGITMSEPDEALAQHMGVEPDEVFQVDRVIEGLPAASAGLKALDIVVAIDGAKPATQERLRDVMRTKKPGDTLELRILRKGHEENLSIKLEPYDPSKLGQEIAGVQDEMFNALGGGQAGGGMQHLREQLEAALEEIKSNPNLQPEKIRAQAMAALEKAIDAASSAGNTLSDHLAELRSRGMMLFGSEPGQVYSIPGGVDVEQRMERVHDQLDRIEKRLAEIERRLSRPTPREREQDRAHNMKGDNNGNHEDDGQPDNR